MMSITAFSYSNWHNPVTNTEVTNNSLLDIFPNRPVADFAYDVDSRYLMTITKAEIDQVRSMKSLMPQKDFTQGRDFIPVKEVETFITFRSVSVSIIDHNYRAVAIETGDGDLFNAAQLNLLQTAPYSSNILIKAEYQEKDNVTGALYYKYATPHITIIPEMETQYVLGNDALIEYLREGSKEKTGNVITAKLKPGKVGFTVTSTATISKVKLLSSSGYPAIDGMMLELISTIPGRWNPASNAEGEKVDQELVFSFGMIGC